MDGMTKCVLKTCILRPVYRVPDPNLGHPGMSLSMSPDLNVAVPHQIMTVKGSHAHLPADPPGVHIIMTEVMIVVM